MSETTAIWQNSWQTCNTICISLIPNITVVNFKLILFGTDVSVKTPPFKTGLEQALWNHLQSSNMIMYWCQIIVLNLMSLIIEMCPFQYFLYFCEATNVHIHEYSGYYIKMSTRSKNCWWKVWIISFGESSQKLSFSQADFLVLPHSRPNSLCGMAS